MILYSGPILCCTCACAFSRVSHVQLFARLWTVTLRLLCWWAPPGKNAGVGCHVLLQMFFPNQGSNLSLLHYRQILYRCLDFLSPQSPLDHAPKHGLAHQGTRTHFHPQVGRYRSFSPGSLHMPLDQQHPQGADTRCKKAKTQMCVFSPVQHCHLHGL